MVPFFLINSVTLLEVASLFGWRSRFFSFRSARNAQSILTRKILIMKMLTMKMNTKTSKIACLTVVAFAINHANAAVIAWEETLVDTTSVDGAGAGLGDSAVSTDGTLVEAINFGNSANVTVNGVLFSGLTTGDTTYYDNQLDTNDPDITGTSVGGGSKIDVLTTSFASYSGVSTHSGTLIGLTSGYTYQVQLISSFDDLARTTTFNDGLGNTIVQHTNDPHSFSTGTFKAVGTTQTLNFTAAKDTPDENTPSAFLNAYQLRLLAVPEPSSTALLGIAGLALALRRKR